MNNDGVAKSSVPPSSSSPPTDGEKKKKSSKSNDSRHYEGVYYGSSDDEDNDIAAVLGDIGEPDENEEPYDILADNGEFLYSETDQRQYISTTTTAPSTAAMDLMLSGAEGSAASIGMMSITEEENEEEDEDEDVGQKVTDTPKRSNRRSSNQQDILFKPGSGANAEQQPRRPSPPTPMYLMPQDYKVQHVGSFDSENPSGSDSGTDSGDDRSASSSILTGSMKKLVKDIDGVLDEMNAQGVPRGAASNPNDDDTIASDMTVGGTTQLSGELQRAQNVFWEFSGIDATGFEQTKKSRKKKRLVASHPPLRNEGNATRGKKKTKRSTMFVLCISYTVFIGALVVAFVFLRQRKIQTEISVASSADTLTTLPPTISPVAEDQPIALSPEVDGGSGTNENVISRTNAPTIAPSTELPSFTPSLRPSEQHRIPALTPTPTEGPEETPQPTAQPTQPLAPSLRPTRQFWIPVPGVPSSSGRSKTFNPTAKPTQDTSTLISRQSPLPSNDRGTPNVGAVGGSQHSFPVPEKGSSRPWDDDDIFEGQDDFYSDDGEYEYELHHPNRVTIKEGKHHGKQNPNKKLKFEKHRNVDSFQWQQRVSVPGIRGRQRPPRSYYYDGV